MNEHLSETEVQKRMPKNLIPKQDSPPGLPHTLPDRHGNIFAVCPKCRRVKNIRICYGCRQLMCEDCLTEHQVGCLYKECPGINYCDKLQRIFDQDVLPFQIAEGFQQICQACKYKE